MAIEYDIRSLRAANDKLLQDNIRLHNGDALRELRYLLRTVTLKWLEDANPEDYETLLTRIKERTDDAYQCQ